MGFFGDFGWFLCVLLFSPWLVFFVFFGLVLVFSFVGFFVVFGLVFVLVYPPNTILLKPESSVKAKWWSFEGNKVCRKYKAPRTLQTPAMGQKENPWGPQVFVYFFFNQ